MPALDELARAGRRERDPVLVALDLFDHADVHRSRATIPFRVVTISAHSVSDTRGFSEYARLGEEVGAAFQKRARESEVIVTYASRGERRAPAPRRRTRAAFLQRRSFSPHVSSAAVSTIYW